MESTEVNAPANPVEPALPAAQTNQRKRPGKRAARLERKKQRRNATVKTTRLEGSSEEVLLADVQALLESHTLTEREEPLRQTPYEAEVLVTEISSTGDGIGFNEQDQRVYVVPFSVPGDRVLVKVFKHDWNQPVSLTDFVKVVEPSKLRDDSRVRCQYFSKCSGCQFQMLSYEEQLAHKKRVMERAYANFSNLNPALVPSIDETMPSPLQFGYRTKLTPHFDGPPGARRRGGAVAKFETVPPIGFMKKGTRHTIDIEDCPIGTDAVRRGMARERKRVAEKLDTYRKGVTILLREDTLRLTKEGEGAKDAPATPSEAVLEETDRYKQYKTCETVQTATTTEYIGDYVFKNPAGAFFQNNNSILAPFTEFVGALAQPLGRQDAAAAGEDGSEPVERRRMKYLVDAYSGSGLFTITLAHLFERSVGIDISSSSIEYASQNARLNGLDPERAFFMAADAVRIFDSATADFRAEETVVVIDPPRKGCDVPFLRQLLAYGPSRVVYVSCNVHTQARDVGVLVNGLPDGCGDSFADAVKADEPGRGPYRLSSLRGMDFFPQTGHVEGVAVLVRKE